MTNKDAIDYFKRSYANGTNDDERQHNECLDLAIKALEKIDKIYLLLDPDIDQEIALDKIREVTYD